LSVFKLTLKVGDSQLQQIENIKKSK